MAASEAPAHRRQLATGVYPTLQRTAVLPEQLATEILESLDVSGVAVVLFACDVMPARSAVAVSSGQLELSFTTPLLDWVEDVRTTRRLDVPVELRRLLRCFRALVFPLATPVLHLGSVAVPAQDHAAPTIRTVERLTTDFALRLETWQRQEFLAQLDDIDEEAHPSSRPQVRASSVPPTSSRRSA
jgi:hypothetical protein